jgi:Mycolic acid cyclopropane synthetase
MRILDLGCGWRSLSLWLAERYPAASITGVSNSNGQRAWIESERDRRGLRNLEIITADVNEYEPTERFDRVMSIEMFEHMRNWHELLRRISTWLEDGGKAFVHVLSHRTLPYLFEDTWASTRVLHRRCDAQVTTCCRASRNTCGSPTRGSCPAPTTPERWRPGSSGSTRDQSTRGCCSARPGEPSARRERCWRAGGCS